MTKPYTIIRRFLFELVGMISLDRNYYQVVINLSFALPHFCYIEIYLKLRKYCNFGAKMFSTSFQRERLKRRRSMENVAAEEARFREAERASKQFDTVRGPRNSRAISLVNIAGRGRVTKEQIRHVR